MPRKIFEATKGEVCARFRINYIVRNFVIFADHAQL